MPLYQVRLQGKEELDMIPDFVASDTELSFAEHLTEASSTIFKLYAILWLAAFACRIKLNSILVKPTAEYLGHVFMPGQLGWIWRYKGKGTEFNMLC